ncbi:MAG: cupredoxin domain-containing protein [Candidatus Micrarchaeota archaeon]
MDGITIHKTTLMVFVGLILAILLGGYVVFSAPQQNALGTSGNGNDVSSGIGGAAAQDIYIKALSNGAYDKQEITVKVGVPVRLHFTADPNAGCGRQLVIYGLNVKALSRNGEENVVEFTPSQEGTYEYNCGRRMWQPGKLVVQ